MAEAGVPRVVVTKLAVPVVRTQTIARDRLTRLLTEAGDAPLTVVCAPAGFGKTTALVEWLERAGPCVWVSVDDQDNDPRRLCAHLLAGLDRIRPAAMAEAELALLGGSDLVDTVVPAAVDALSDGDRLAIVIDDYHVVTEPECHRLLIALIDSLPAGVRVVVSSRTVPPLRLGRRRAAGAVAEIGPHQLAFRGAEAELLLNGALRLGLAPAQISAIDDRVDGWPAGLALVASSLPAGPDRDDFLSAFARSSDAVAEYLIEEVLDATDDRVRDFLCRTSILGRLSAPLCVAVLEDPGAAELLAEVRRSNLFVTVLDGDWVRYHDLFAELLERELRSRSPELIPELHRRAAEWFSGASLPEDAIRHATLAGDGERAAALLHQHWRTLFDERRYTTLRQLIAGLPEERGPLGPFCEAVDALCMGLDGVDLRLVSERLDALEPQRDAPGVAQMIDHTRTSPYYGDVERAVSDGLATWERYPDMGMRAVLAPGLGVVLWFAGDRDGVRRVLLPYLGVIGPRLRSWALAALALSAADDGDADLAERYGREAVEIAVAGGSMTALECHFAYVAYGEALRLQGALDRAEEQLDAAARLTARVPGTLFQAFTLTFEAQRDVTAGERPRARARAAAARAIADGYPDTGVLAERLTEIEAALQRGAGATRGSAPTPGELRVLTLLASGMTREEIAGRLFVSKETVRSHVRRLYQRLGVHSREEAVAVARQRGLL